MDRRNRVNLIVGLLLILAGVFFLVSRWSGFNRWETLWPFIIIAFGGLFFIGMILGGKTAGALAVPGSILVTIGLILLFQSLFDYYQSWAYAWALIVASVGVGTAIYGMWSGQPDLRRSGWSLAGLGVVLFIVFGAIFEFIFSIGGRGGRLPSLLWPILLIVLGAWLFFSRAFKLLRRESRLSWNDRDLFWPVLFMGFGLLWLLVNQGQLPFKDISALFVLWPLLIVAAGLDLIFGRRWPLLGALIAAALVAGVLWLSLNAERLQLTARFPAAFSGEVFMSDVPITERVSGSGVIQEEERPVRGFNRLRLEAGGLTEIVPGETESLSIQADDNLLPYLISDVSGGELRISVKPGVSISPSQPVRFTIGVKDLRRVILTGSGQANLAGFSGQSLELEASGSARFDLSSATIEKLQVEISGSGGALADGIAEELQLHISGAGKLDAGDLRCREAVVEISGAGNAVLWVTDELQVDLSGASRLAYYGAPALRQEISGASRVESLGAK